MVPIHQPILVTHPLGRACNSATCAVALFLEGERLDAILHHWESLCNGYTHGVRKVTRTIRTSMKETKFLVSVAAISCCLSSQAANNEVTHQLVGLVIQVDDGDTVVVLQPDRGRFVIRLTDIDAPEVRHGKSRPGQPFGLTAKRKMEALVLGRPVRADCYAQESYGRSICRIFVNGVDAGAELVKVGLAWIPNQKRYVRDPGILELSAQAQRGKIGLWSVATPVAPWVWRKNCWVSKQCEGNGDE